MSKVSLIANRRVLDLGSALRVCREKLLFRGNLSVNRQIPKL